MSAHPSRRVRAAATWLAVYPLVTVVLAVTRPVLDVAPLPLQTLVLTAVVVPVAVLWAVPLLLRLLTGAVPVRAADPHPPLLRRTKHDRAVRGHRLHHSRAWPRRRAA